MVNFMLSCGRCLKTELLRSRKIAKFLQRNESSNKIRIPPRKNRGPLDILQALASTVKYEPGITEYRFQYGGIFDDSSPYLKRRVAMSMDSGRKAAKWVVAGNPKLFQHKYADPYIKAFAPPKIIDENTPVSEETLLAAIDDVKVEEAIKLYKLMKEKNIDVSMATKQLLLEMVCYFNCQNKPDETLVETKYSQPAGHGKGVTVNTWEKNGFAEELFSEIEPNLESYTALILGRFKYNNISNAMKLYDEAKEKGIEFGVDMYNALLEHVTDKVFEHEDQEAYIINLLKEMKEKNIEPNLGTLNSTLKSVATMKKWLKARSLAVKLYQEFRGMGIKPCLATYYYLIEIFSDRNRVSPAFTEILRETEKIAFVARHPDDFKFFNKAMDVASYDFKSVSLAHRVHKILMTGNNRYFLSDSLDCLSYYRAYITTALRYGDLDEGVTLLESFVPQAYNPEIVGVLIIIGTLKAKNGEQFLPRIWPLINEIALKSHKAVLELMPLIEGGMILHKDDTFMEIAKETWESCKDHDNVMRNSNNMTSFLKIFALGEDKALSDAVFVKAVTFGAKYVELDFESLDLYTDLCISNDDKKMALTCLEYAAASKLNQAKLLAVKVKSKFQLEKDEEKFIEDLLKKQEKMEKANKEEEKKQLMD